MSERRAAWLVDVQLATICNQLADVRCVPG